MFYHENCNIKQERKFILQCNRDSCTNKQQGNRTDNLKPIQRNAFNSQQSELRTNCVRSLSYKGITNLEVFGRKKMLLKLKKLQLKWRSGFFFFSFFWTWILLCNLVPKSDQCLEGTSYSAHHTLTSLIPTWSVPKTGQNITVVILRDTVTRLVGLFWENLAISVTW